MNLFEVPGHEPSFVPEGADWRLAMADEFDGTELNRDLWDYRLSMMGSRWPAWTDRGVRLDGRGNCVFELMLEDGRPVSSQLQTGYNFMDEPSTPPKPGRSLRWQIGKLRRSRFLHGPGYYECRCRLQQQPGWWSAFWIQSPTIGASADSYDTGVELDIMESFKPGEVVKRNLITGGYGPDRICIKTGEVRTGMDTSVFHRFGLLWDETGYTFFIDGEEDGKITSHFTPRPEFILISTEVRGYRNADMTPEPAAFEAVGDTFLVDYVRVFDRA